MESKRDELWAEWSKDYDFDEYENQARAGWDAGWSAALKAVAEEQMTGEEEAAEWWL